MFVNDAEAGHFVDELDNRLGVGTQDALRKLVGDGRLTRHKLAGQFLYGPTSAGDPSAPRPTAADGHDRRRADLMRSCGCCSPASSMSASSPDSNRSSAGGAATGAASLLGIDPHGRHRPPAARRPSRSTGCGARAADEHRRKKNTGSHRPHRSPDDPRDGRGPGQRPEVDAPHDRQARTNSAGSASTSARRLAQAGHSLRVNHKKLAGASQTEPAGGERQQPRRYEEEGARRHVPSRRQVGPHPESTTTSAPTPTAAPCPTASTTPARRHRLRRQNRRHPGVRRRLHREVVAHRGPALSRSQDPADPGRRRWQQQLHGARLEVQSATSLLQPARLAREGSPLPAGHVEVEPHRTPPVLEISKNWAGRPLDSFETILKYLRTTRTSTGLRVRAHLVRKTYETGVKVTDAQMRELRITPNSVLPKWNYTIEPMDENGIYFCVDPWGPT